MPFKTLFDLYADFMTAMDIHHEEVVCAICAYAKKVNSKPSTVLAELRHLHARG